MSSESITLNGNEYDPEVVSAGVSLFRESLNQNARGIQPTSGGGLGGADISSDATITRWLGQQYNGDRDIHKVLGYPSLDDDTALERYRAKYEYQDIASRIIDEFPKETWKNPPEVVDVEEDTSEFEVVANNLIQSELNGYWRRLDRAQRLGEYGLMVIGVDDGQSLDEPVQESAVSSTDDISFYNIFPQEQVEDWDLGKESDQFEVDPSDERYNKPIQYYIDFGDIDAESTDDDFKWVHWTRVIHVAEGALETDLKGEPALKKIFYRLEDRQKVIGASAEMFWSGADEKIIANVSEDFALQQYDDQGERENFKEQLESLLHDMQKYVVSSGMEFEVIGGQEVDPSGVVDTIDTAIASAVGMPKNKLQGNETGERSTTMDRNNWFDTISSRQTNLASPQFVRQTIDRLLGFGILPSPVEDDYGVTFPDLFEQSETDTAEIQSQRASTLQASGLAMTLSSEQKLTYIQDGPSAVDMDTETRELPVDESEPEVQNGFQDLFENELGVNATVSMSGNIPDEYLDEFSEDQFIPPEAAQEKAQRILDLRDEKENVNGGTDKGWSRAEQIAAGIPIPPDEVRQIDAWFSRHPKSEADHPEDVNPWEDNGWTARMLWGWDAAEDWAGGLADDLRAFEEGDTENSDTTWWRIWD
jgi:hypothetical protein